MKSISFEFNSNVNFIGTTSFFVLCSQRPEYNTKIEMMHAMAPVAFMSHCFSPPIRIVAPFVSVLKVSSHYIQNYRQHYAFKIKIFFL